MNRKIKISRDDTDETETKYKKTDFNRVYNLVMPADTIASLYQYVNRIYR